MSSDNEELYSLLVPLVDDRLIVPRACVAEVVRFSAPKQQPGSKSWMLGEVMWNGRPLPVVSFEGALGKDVPVATGRTRIVVFYATAGKLRTGYFGILTQGFPQLVRVNKDVLKLAAKEGWPEGAPVLCKVKMINEYPLIPDLEKLETLLAAEAEQA
ncbi:MAG TPA: chemotaxis protein CheW [Woeseiaceae bacterium]